MNTQRVFIVEVCVCSLIFLFKQMPLIQFTKTQPTSSPFWYFKCRCRNMRDVRALESLNKDYRYRVAFRLIGGFACGVLWKYDASGLSQRKVRDLIPVGRIQAIQKEEIAYLLIQKIDYLNKRL